jgi:hypothetical protein
MPTAGRPKEVKVKINSTQVIIINLSLLSRKKSSGPPYIILILTVIKVKNFMAVVRSLFGIEIPNPKRCELEEKSLPK